MKKMEKSLLTLNEVLSAVDGIHVLGGNNFFFSSVQTDSRNVEKNTLFVPLIGENQDGHIYCQAACQKGASVIFIAKANFEKEPSVFVDLSKDFPDVYFIAVENTLTALQNAAEAYVEKFPSLIKIAVTGSSGKTTTKEILASILKQKYKVITNKGNFNSETGLPLSVFNIRQDDQVGLFEMGMNRQNEIGEISKVLKARYALVTNIGTAHIGKLGSRENIAREKCKVFDYLNSFGCGFIPQDDDFASFMKDYIDGNGHVICYGNGCDPNVKFLEDRGLDGSLIQIGDFKALLTLPGKYNYKNALGAIALAKHLSLTDQEIARGIEELKAMFGRSQVLHGKYTVLQDCYNANPDSMEKAIDFVSSVTSSCKKIFVLGDMLELGESSFKDHQAVGKQALSSSADMVIFIGKEMKAAFDAAESGNSTDGKSSSKIFKYFEGHSDADIEKACSVIKDFAGEKDILLVKASRGMGLERIRENLEGKNN